MVNVQSIVAEAGGKAAVAASCEVTPGAVDKWVAAGKIPARHWPQMVRLGGGRITWAMLSGECAGAPPQGLGRTGEVLVTARFLDWRDLPGAA